jgi:hypothetical protein
MLYFIHKKRTTFCRRISGETIETRKQQKTSQEGLVLLLRWSSSRQTAGTYRHRYASAGLAVG